MIITSLVATVSTLPVIAINFNNISIYSVISNLFAVPLTSVYLMPCVILYFIAYLISCELLIIKLIKPGLIIFEKIAQYVSHLPHANIKISYINHSLVYSLILVFTSSLFLRSRDLRRIFLVIGSVLAIYVPFSVETAHIIINKKLQIALFENNHRQMEFSSRKVPSWYKSAYMAYMGAEETDYNPDIRTSEFCCDNGYCAYSRGNKRLIFKVKDLFYSRRSPNSCDNFRDIYDYNHIVDLAEIKEGIYAIFTDNKIKIVQFEELNYNRPWNK